MNKHEEYREQVALVLRILPHIYELEQLAVHGGTAINLFHKNMPRYSVDIDLTYLPIEDRETSLREINRLLGELRIRLLERVKGIRVIHKQDVWKLLCTLDMAMVKVEVNGTKRGALGAVETRSLCVAAEADFHTKCKAHVVGLSQLYGGKLSAALSRQHPRDLFDFVHMDCGFDEVRDGLLLALAGSDKPIIESLAPNAIAHHADREEQLSEPDYTSKDEMMRSILLLTLDHVIWRRLIRASLYRDNHISAVEGVNIGEDHYTLPRLLFFSNTFVKCDKELYHYNCMNINSYVQSSQNSFNYKRYQNDRDSISILIEFFKTNDDRFLDQLNTTKAQFIYSQFFSVLKLRKRGIYHQLCVDWSAIDNKYKNMSQRRIRLLTSSYYFNVIRVYARIFLKKTIGIKRYNL